MPGFIMSDDSLSTKVATMDGHLNELVQTVRQLADSNKDQAKATIELMRALERHDVNNEQQWQINRDVQTGLKELTGRVGNLEMTQAKAVTHEKQIADLRQDIKVVSDRARQDDEDRDHALRVEMAAQSKKIGEIEDISKANATKLGAIWSISIKVVGALLTAAVMGALGFYLGGS